MEIICRKATLNDIELLIKLRFEYLMSDRGMIADKEKAEIQNQLTDYFGRQIGIGFIAYIAEDNNNAVATAFIALSEKPANPTFITGKTATILNVFTYPEYRRKGIATKLLELLIEEAKSLNISYIELSATPTGKPLYEKLGFVYSQSHNTEMKLRLI